MNIPSQPATPETMPLAASVLNAANRMTPAQRAQAMKKRRRAGQMQLAPGAMQMGGEGGMPAASVLA